MECMIVGTRPQILKLYGYLKDVEGERYIIHSGQHYDYEMSKIFFEVLNIPEPDINLNVKKGYWLDQARETMGLIAKKLEELKPETVTIFGDCTTTFAGMLAAKKMRLPLTHVECGYRHETAIDPEDYIRTFVDNVSDRLITYNDYAIENLISEGVDRSRIETSDNFMTRALVDSVPHAEKIEATDEYDYLMTLHRNEHKNKEKLTEIFGILAKVQGKILFPCHPATKAIIDEQDISIPDNIELMPPQGYLKFLNLLLNCKTIITDSGGIQVEAFELKKKCITLNMDTCWLHTLEGGMNTAVGKDLTKILDIV
jgi:UDP-N-acetylglucosamine 2-epimerase